MSADSLPAIQFENVTKTYAMVADARPSIAALLGLRRTRAATGQADFTALNDVSLEVGVGERVGIIGRNGAGKTTLLKLLCGNFAPTSGVVQVNGSIQALMSMGTGFHPEYSGRKNAEASLKFNGLSRQEMRDAMDDVVEFCELGDFFDQPFKNYSLGMQARLMFATATAIKPEILLIDEVLGAGDAYFIAKSKQRVEQLVDSGCTMLLVSHSTQQILELCSRAIWMDAGQVRMQGDAFLVVKAYEEFMHGPISGVAASRTDDEKGLAAEAAALPVSRMVTLLEQALMQEPEFTPHVRKPEFPAVEIDPGKFYFEAQGGISRWESEEGLKVCGFCVLTERGITNELVTLRPAAFVLSLKTERSGSYSCRYGIALHDYQGNCLTRIYSPEDRFAAVAGQLRQVTLLLNPNQIGPGEFVVGISVLEFGPLELLNSTPRYDLLSRSFTVKMELPESEGALEAAIMHSAEWTFE